MTRLIKLGAAILINFVALAGGATAPATQPAKPTVLVLSFTMAEDSGGSWIARAVRDDMVSGLKRDLDATVRSPSVRHEASDPSAAIALGKEYHADYVICGYVQEVGSTARITGQVLDMQNGLAVGGLKVTGPASQLLQIDDALAAQTLQSLPQSMVRPVAIAALQRFMTLPESDNDAPSADGLAMMSQSYPTGAATFISPILDTAPIPQIENTTYVYLPTMIVAGGYGYQSPFYYGPYAGYPLFAVGPIDRAHHHGPVFHHGPARPGFDGSQHRGGDGIVIADGFGAGGSVPVSFTYGQNPGPVGTPFMGGGQSFPAQNGFVTIGASSGFSVFTAPRFATPSFPRGFTGRATR